MLFFDVTSLRPFFFSVLCLLCLRNFFPPSPSEKSNISCWSWCSFLFHMPYSLVFNTTPGKLGRVFFSLPLLLFQIFRNQYLWEFRSKNQFWWWPQFHEEKIHEQMLTKTNSIAVAWAPNTKLLDVQVTFYSVSWFIIVNGKVPKMSR